MAQRRDEGDGFPVPMRDFLDEPLAQRCSPVEAGDRRRDADQALAAAFARPYVRRRRLAGPARQRAGFFLKRKFKWCRNREIDD